MPGVVKQEPHGVKSKGITVQKDSNTGRSAMPMGEDEGGVALEPDVVTDEPTEKKRKRTEAQEDDLEIDVGLPEPPSKKAQRKAKRLKSGASSGDKTKVSRSGVTEEDAEPKPTDLDESETKPAKSAHSVWIGNMPFIIDKKVLSNFLTASDAISQDSITRIHMPAPANAKSTKTTLKPVNKGFAYVDFSTLEALEGALALSETQLGGRNLLIKNAKDFGGRPEKPTAGTAGVPDASAGKALSDKKARPSRRVFVGNLGFDVTKEDLEAHFGLAGDIENIHMATFQDTGKCKGFAWVTFATNFEIHGKEKSGEEAAGDAVKGFTYVAQKREDEDDDVQSGEDEQKDSTSQKSKKKLKNKKWFINRLQGRDLRCEFAEDPNTRYKKRFGKEAKQRSEGQMPDAITEPGAESADVHIPGRQRAKSTKRQVDGFLGDIQPGAPTDPTKRRGKRPVDPQAEAAKYRTGGIAESTGSKMTFD